MIDLGKRIKRARKAKGLTQEELADRVDVSRSAVARWELGEIEPSLSHMILVAKALETSLDVLVGIRGSGNAPEAGALPSASDLEMSPEARRALEKFIAEIRK